MRRMLRCLLAAAVLAALMPGVAESRTNNRTKPVVFVHGYSFGESNDCEGTWRKMISRFRAWGWTKTFYPVRYYVGDTACSTTDSVSSHSRVDHHGSHSSSGFGGTNGHEGSNPVSHNSDASIRHLAYHWAWYVYEHFSINSTYVDVAAHSMGGLIVRYAMWQTAAGNVNFPPRLLVEDIVTMGTPHDGTNNANFCLLDTQCQEMKPDSTFMNNLRNYARNPQGAGGTDWTVIGAHDDDVITATSATAMSVYNAVRYRSGQAIEHGDYMHRTRDISDAVADVWDRWAGSYALNYAWFWPVRNADWALMDSMT